MKTISKLSLITLIIALLIVVISTGLTSCSSSTGSPGTKDTVIAFNSNDIVGGIFKPTATIAGKTYSQWASTWWQWAMGIPATGNGQIFNPLLDTTGSLTSMGNRGSSMFFLAGLVSTPDPGKNIIRTVTIPHTHAIFFPIGAMLQDPFISGTSNTDVMHANLTDFIGNRIGDVNIKLDGVGILTINTRNTYKFSNSEAFNYTIPDNNIYTYIGKGVNAGIVTPAFADGFYVMLGPLAPGPHDLTFNAVIRNIVRSVTYKITSN